MVVRILRDWWQYYITKPFFLVHHALIIQYFFIGTFSLATIVLLVIVKTSVITVESWLTPVWVPLITYYWTGLLILDHSYLVVELDKFKNCWNKFFRTSKILTLFYQQFLNLLISQRDMSGPRLGTPFNNRCSGVSISIANDTTD